MKYRYTVLTHNSGHFGPPLPFWAPDPRHRRGRRWLVTPLQLSVPILSRITTSVSPDQSTAEKRRTTRPYGPLPATLCIRPSTDNSYVIFYCYCYTLPLTTINLRLYCSALRLCCACQLHVSTKTSLYDVRAGSVHPSLRLSVCPVLLLRVCCCGPVGREISIVNCLTTKYDDSAAFARRSSRCCAIDRYLLADGPTAANPQRANGTDRQTDGRAAVMYIMRAVPIIISTIVIDWATPTSARSALAKLLLLLLYC